MGYRTNGAWVIKGPVPQIIAAWAKCRLTLTIPNTGEDLWNYFELYRVGNTGFIRFSYEGWKWYESFSDIQFFESVWSALNDFADEAENPAESISGKRVHIGEDSATDDRAFGDDAPDLYVSVSIGDHEPDDGAPLNIPAPETTSP